MASRQDARSLWISIPNAGSFMRNLRKGRDALKRIVKNSKFREALELDVLKRKLKGTKLGMRYGRRSDLMRDCVPSATTAAVVSHGATPAPLSATAGRILALPQRPSSPTVLRTPPEV